MYWRLAFISLACLIYLTDACLRAETNPAHVDHAVNLRFSIKCTFYPCGGDDIKTVISLKLLRTSGSSSQKIGQISDNWSDRKSHYFPFGYKVVNSAGQSHPFLSAEWTVPYVQSPSFYQCVAVGRDRAGRLHTFKKLALLGGGGGFSFGGNRPYGPRLRQCLAREKALSNERTQYQTQLTTARWEVSRCQAAHQALSNERTQCQNQLTTSRWKVSRCQAAQQALSNERTQCQNQFAVVRDELRKINEARGVLFHGALHYGGHRYYVSKFQFETVETAQAICRSTGGYLVELDDASEYYTFRKYVIRLHLRAESVLLGGTDQAREGTWVFQHSGRYIPYFDWIRGEPNNDGKEDCMSLWLPRGARMNDIHCWRVGPVVLFACEVPSSADL